MPLASPVEHIALNVPDPVGAAEWYAANLGMRVLRSGPPPANARFLADAAGRTVLELYCDANAPLPDYAAMDPQTLHVAFLATDAAAAAEELVGAGATVAKPLQTLETGDAFAMLRDPWGLALQIMQRAESLTG